MARGPGAGRDDGELRAVLPGGGAGGARRDAGGGRGGAVRPAARAGGRAGRRARRWGRTAGPIGFHGGKVAVMRPRVRERGGREVVLPSWEQATAEDWL